ncbi:C-type mannose receptor 2-like [Glandiceps talaboti]
MAPTCLCPSCAMKLLVLLILVAAYAHGQLEKCPEDGGWVEWTSGGQTHCYRCFTNMKPWLEAQAICNSYGTGASLASIHSNQENNKVLEVCSGEWDLWIGMNDLEREWTYEWVDKTDVVWTNWASGEPDKNSRGLFDGDVNCIEQRNEGLLPGAMKLLVLLILVAAYAHGQLEKCPEDGGWVEWTSGGQTHCYRCFTNVKPWLEAQAICNSYGTGASLASIHSNQENNKVLEVCSGEWDLWIGMNDLEREWTYEWVDKTDVVWTNWASGEPDKNSRGLFDGDVNCIEQRNEGLLPGGEYSFL